MKVIQNKNGDILMFRHWFKWYKNIELPPYREMRRQKNG